MTPATRALLGLAAIGVVGVVAVVGYRWFAGEAAPEAAPPPTPMAAMAPTIRPGPGFAPPPAAGAAPAAPIADTLLHAALQRRFHGLLPRELEDRLRAGEVREVAERLAVATAPGSAAALAELAALCQESAATAADEPAARAAAPSPGTAAALAPLEAARRTALDRLRGGCASAHFDLAAINERLTATANGGDVASLERIALTGVAPARLASAALLGAPRAQWRMALEQQKEHPELARSWLEAAARKDADAAAYYGSCLLAGCFGAPDPAAARTTIEAAARRGSVTALGILAGADAAPWSSPDVPVVPLPPGNPDALGLASTDRLAWATLAGELARRGCFGLDLPTATLALGARDRLASQLAPSAGEQGDRAGQALIAATGDATRESLGCH